MPGQDRTGPAGQGSRTGRGMGLCNPNNASTNNQVGYGRGQGMGRGFGRGFNNRCFGGGRGRGMGFMNRVGNFFGFGRQQVSEQQQLQNYVTDLETQLKEAKDALKNFSNAKDTTDDK